MIMRDEELLAMAAEDECMPHIHDYYIYQKDPYPHTDRCTCGVRFYRVKYRCRGCNSAGGYEKVCLVCYDFPFEVEPFPGD